jgi:hypothetical protein
LPALSWVADEYRCRFFESVMSASKLLVQLLEASVPLLQVGTLGELTGILHAFSKLLGSEFE